MSTRTAVGLGICGLLLGAGLALGAAGLIPTLLATAMAALGFSLGAALSVLCLMDAVWKGRRRGGVTHVDPNELGPVIEHAAMLAEMARERGYLALVDADQRVEGPAGWVFEQGAEHVIRGDAPAAIRTALREEVMPRLEGVAWRRGIAATGLSVGCAGALLIAFVILVDAMGLALDPTRIGFGAAIGLFLSVYAAFGLAIVAPTVVDRLASANERQAMEAMLAIEGMVAIRQGYDSAGIRTLLNSAAARGADTTRPGTRDDAIAA